MKIFICDKCGAEFEQPLDEEMIKDEHGVWHTLDLCAPCRVELKSGQDAPKATFLSEAIQKQISIKALKNEVIKIK